MRRRPDEREYEEKSIQGDGSMSAEVMEKNIELKSGVDRVFTNPDADAAREYFRGKSRALKPKLATVEEVVRGCDVLVTATPSDSPIVKDEWVHEGMHINCVGTYAKGKQEIEGAILKRAVVVVDDWEQASHAGEINVPVSRGEFDRSGVYAELPEIAAGLKPGRIDDAAITVFDTTGLAIQDVVTAWKAFEVAEQRNLGFLIEPLYT